MERLKEEKKIDIKNVLNKELIQKLAHDIGLGAGEAESIAAALESKSKTILTDNKQGRKAAKIYGLNLLGSIEIIIALYKKQKISKEKALTALKILKEKGWFQNYLIEEAKKEVHHA